MRTYIHTLCCAVVLCGWTAGPAIAVDNPLEVAVDGAMVRYNGMFYGMAAQTNGQMMVSDNLLNWSSPTQVIPEDVDGPYELIYRNGLFYLYASTKGYAVGDLPQQAFTSVRRSALSGTEMRMHQDKSGALFSVNRHLGSKKEGEIWMQRYAAPWKTADRPSQLLDGRRGMWDSIDAADLGEPDILDYRGSYYLLYTANHPGPRTGLREIGVAMNEKPQRLANTDKVADPVLVRNVERLNSTYAVVLPSGEYGEWEGRYITTSPDKGWETPEFELSRWRTGEGAFGFPDKVDEAQIHPCRTKWKEDEIWIRRTFDLPGEVPETPVLNIRHEGAVQVFLNGKLVYESATPSVAYSNFEITEAAKGAFRAADNVVAVHARAPKKADFRYIDFGILDAKDNPVEPTVYGLDGPRLIAGPNGLEKWVTYRAWWNGEEGTGLDRVFFYNKEMVIDGPTTALTPGYHPPPLPPTFSDRFPDNESVEWAERWNFTGGAWFSADGALQQTEVREVAKAYLKQPPAAHYLFETDIRFPTSGKGNVGVVAWSNGKQDLVISINPVDRSWEYHIEPGSLSPRKFKLPKAFKRLEKPPGVGETAVPLHRLRVMKNGNYFDVMLDDFQLTREKPLITKLYGEGVPGLYCGKSAAAFDGVVYTLGWDEHDEYITGWGSAADGASVSGEWKLDDDDGLEQCRHSEPGVAFKGDLLNQYEFTVNAELEEFEEGKERLYGVFPVFTDRDNYLKAMIDTRERKLVVTGKLNGRELNPLTRSLNCRVSHRHIYDEETAYRDLTHWVYQLRSQSVITALDIRWIEGEYDHLRQEFYVPVDDMAIRYAKLERGRKPALWEDGRFNDADEPKPKTQKARVLNRVDIRPETGNYIGFSLYEDSAIVIDSRTGRYIRDYTPGEDLGRNEEIGDDLSESDTMSRPQETLISLEVESAYFFRCVKLKDRVIIELNGRPMLEVEGAWPPSQVGLITEGQPCFFNGITLMHIPEQD